MKKFRQRDRINNFLLSVDFLKPSDIDIVQTLEESHCGSRQAAWKLTTTVSLHGGSIS